MISSINPFAALVKARVATDAAEGHEDLTVVSDSTVRDVTDPPLAYGNPILFAGYSYDNETGLYHVRHRMYSPTLARWLQRDPAGYVAGMNVYTYGGNSPTSVHDPFGLKPNTCEYAGAKAWLDPRWRLVYVWATDIQPPELETGQWGDGCPGGLLLRRLRYLYFCCDSRDRFTALWGAVQYAAGTNTAPGKRYEALNLFVASVPLPYGKELVFALGVGCFHPMYKGRIGAATAALERDSPGSVTMPSVEDGVPAGYKYVESICCRSGRFTGIPPVPAASAWNPKPSVAFCPGPARPPWK